MATLWGKLTSKYFYYTSQDPVVKKSTLEYYQLLKHVFEMRATTDSKVHFACCLVLSLGFSVQLSWIPFMSPLLNVPDTVIPCCLMCFFSYVVRSTVPA